MSKLRVNAFSISLDGYGAGPDQSLDNPLGLGGLGLHAWVFGTPTFRRMHADVASHVNDDDEPSPSVDEEFASRSFENIGAWIMGRNMFTHSRGPWTDDGWKGWWGENPPYHVPVFVLTHHARAPIPMEGGTTFYFVTDGIHAALDRARDAAAGKDVRLGGGVATVREYVAAGLVDELHLAVSPVLLGRGEHLLAGIDMPKLGYSCTRSAATDKATHVVLTK
ncbi:MAG: dihydrofolate reductase family protein [Myxococcales bacterium]|nr:dihydrofolate reductase family protein [Myxococcales bacterium]